MDRLRVSASYTVSLPLRPSFQTSDSTPLPPKPHFTSHLHPLPTADDQHLRSLGDDNELSIFDAERYFNAGEEDGRQGQKKGPAPFGRELDLSPHQRETDASVSSRDGGRWSYRNGSSYATPTASSEASWNSRSGLLSNPPGAVAVSVRAFPSNEQRQGGASSARGWRFRRGCPCSGKKAVDVQEKYSVPMSPSHSNIDSNASVSLNKQKNTKLGEAACDAVSVVASGGVEGAALEELEVGLGLETTKLRLVGGNWESDQKDLLPLEMVRHRIVTSSKPFNDGGAFSFPILCQPAATAKKPAITMNQLDDDDDGPRASLEVFRPKKSGEFHRRELVALYPGDGVPRRSFTIPPSPTARVAAVQDDDLASDSSSDLFEIESLSTQVTSSTAYAAGILQLQRGMAEPATPSAAPSECCYPPSEVSVEWSVATAEGGFDPGSVANFSSAASEYEDAGITQPDNHHKLFTTEAAGGGGKRRGGGLLSCRCEKAVSVGPHPVRCVVDQHHQPPGEGGRARAAARAGMGSSNAAATARAGGAAPFPLARLHSVRVTRPSR